MSARRHPISTATHTKKQGVRLNVEQAPTHSPTPWKLDSPTVIWSEMTKAGEENHYIAMMIDPSNKSQRSEIGDKRAYANAELIVRAVNSYDAMKQALELITKADNPRRHAGDVIKDMQDIAQSALKEAK